MAHASQPLPVEDLHWIFPSRILLPLDASSMDAQCKLLMGRKEITGWQQVWGKHFQKLEGKSESKKFILLQNNFESTWFFTIFTFYEHRENPLLCMDFKFIVPKLTYLLTSLFHRLLKYCHRRTGMATDRDGLWGSKHQPADKSHKRNQDQVADQK